VAEKLETQRLVLRPFTLDDVDAHGRIFSDPLVTRFLPRGPYAADQARDVALRTVSYFIEHWKQHGFGVWAVIDRASGALIGQCGLNTLEEAPEVEVLYLLDRLYWGRGLATEAAQVSVNVGFDLVGLQRIVGLTHPDNVASQRVLQKIGLHHKKRARFFGIDVFIFALDRDERAVTPQSQ
jgi:RimJ/RimL family protein N-acetyltransferase